MLDLDSLIDQGILLVMAERIEKALPAENLLIEMYWIADEQSGWFSSPGSEV